MKYRGLFLFLTMFCIGVLAIIFASVGQSYSDGYKAGFDDAIKQTEAHIRRNYQKTEVATFRESAESKPIAVDEIEVPSEEIEPTPAYSEDDLFCLAAVIYQEAGGNECSDETRRMVADVVLNRVESDGFQNNIRAVLEDAPNGKLQYGTFALTGVEFPPRAEQEREKDAVRRAYDVAKSVLDGNHSELYGNGYIWQAEFCQGIGFWQDGIFFGR